MQFSEEYKQMDVLAKKLKSKLEKLCDDYEEVYEKNEKEKLDMIELEMETYKKQYSDLREKMEKEENRVTVEYWKVYRGDVTKIEMDDGEVEKFLKNYRSNFTGKKSEDDEKLMSIVQMSTLSNMSKYTLNLIKEDFEDAEDDAEYFSELCEKLEKYI
jgi:hypothetical protein